MTYEELRAILNQMAGDDDQQLLLSEPVVAILADNLYALDVHQSGTTQKLMMIPVFED